MKAMLKSCERPVKDYVSLIGRCRFSDALKDAVAAQEEQIQALSAHLIALTPPKPKGRPKAKAGICADVQAECSAPVELAQIQEQFAGITT